MKDEKERTPEFPLEMSGALKWVRSFKLQIVMPVTASESTSEHWNQIEDQCEARLSALKSNYSLS